MKLVTDDWREDDAARSAIRGDLDRSLLVEAAAGTGKTTELIRRLVAMIETDRATVDGIVAVTFTRKAAGELKLRLRQALEKARVETQSLPGKFRLEEAISHLEQARIGTIHSFCAELLRARPVEAGVDPGFLEVADDEGPRLYARAFDRWLQDRLEDLGPGLRRALSRLALTPGFDGRQPVERLQVAGAQLMEWRDYPAPWRRTPFDRERMIDRLLEQIQRLASYARRCSRFGDPLKRGLEPVVLLDVWIERGGLGEGASLQERDYDALEARILEAHRGLNRAGRATGHGGFAEGLPREQVIEERRLLLEALDLFRQAADADLAALLKDELQGSIDAYERLKQSVGKLDFGDLLLKARDLVRDHADARRDFQERISHLFVDEFQDTDPLQAELLLLLAADDPGVADWRAVRPAAGKLFLVGDPKQSIYRFRRADILLYNEIRATLERAGVATVYLHKSYRSVAPLQRFVNAAFASEMDGDAESGRPRYIALGESRQGRSDQPEVVALPVPAPFGYRGMVTQRAIEGSFPDAAAAWIHWLLERSGWTVEDPESKDQVPVQARHVCLLFRRYVSWGSDMTRALTRALEQRSVPHLLIGARSFHQREEVETLRSAMTAIEWPDDELAVFATLRGPLFSFSDEQLLLFGELTGGFSPFSWRRRLERKGKSLQEALVEIGDVLDLLADLHRRRNNRAIVESVQELLAVTRAHAAFALRPAGHQVLGNVEHVCDLARSYELGGGTSFRGFVDRLNSEADRPTQSQAPVVEEGADGVRIMTVHTAKGLEFPVVVLADPTARLAPREPDRTVDGESGLCAMRLLGCTPLDLLHRQDLEHQRDRAEGVRVAYVAATRARDVLVVPVVGVEQRDSWLEPLNKAIYPSTENWRRSSEAPGCPSMGEASVLPEARPLEHDGDIESSVRPGLHRFKDGAYDVVWWDPSILDLGVAQRHGLAHERLLAEDDSGSVSRGNQEAYEAWRAGHRAAIESGRSPSFRVLATTECETPAPVGVESTEVVTLERDLLRPSGLRFGELVHTMLRAARLNETSGGLQSLGRLHGRVLAADDHEIAGAVSVVERALDSDLLRRAHRADELLREAPFALDLDDGTTLEGVVDLLFREGDSWTVIDYKTDLDPGERLDRYRNQVGWYVAAVGRMTGQDCRGVLLMI